MAHQKCLSCVCTKFDAQGRHYSLCYRPWIDSVMGTRDRMRAVPKNQGEAKDLEMVPEGSFPSCMVPSSLGFSGLPHTKSLCPQTVPDTLQSPKMHGRICPNWPLPSDACIRSKDTASKKSRAQGRHFINDTWSQRWNKRLCLLQPVSHILVAS